MRPGRASLPHDNWCVVLRVHRWNWSILLAIGGTYPGSDILRVLPLFWDEVFFFFLTSTRWYWLGSDIGAALSNLWENGVLFFRTMHMLV